MNGLVVEKALTGAPMRVMGDDDCMFTMDYRDALAGGKISTAHDMWHDLGRRTGLTIDAVGNDVWMGTAITIPEPATAGEQMTVACANAADTALGTGIRAVRIYYLDPDGVARTEVVPTNGGNANTVATNIAFVNDFHAISVGTGKSAAGDIALHKTGAAATVYTVIKAGQNRELTQTFKVPAGKQLIVPGWTPTATSGKPVGIALRATVDDGALLPEVFLFEDYAEIQDGGGYRPFAVPRRYPAGVIVKATAFSTQAGGVCSVSIDGWLE